MWLPVLHILVYDVFYGYEVSEGRQKQMGLPEKKSVLLTKDPKRKISRRSHAVSDTFVGTLSTANA